MLCMCYPGQAEIEEIFALVDECAAGDKGTYPGTGMLWWGKVPEGDSYCAFRKMGWVRNSNRQRFDKYIWFYEMAPSVHS